MPYQGSDDVERGAAVAPASEFMTREVATVTPHHTIQEAAFRMKDLRIGWLAVLEGERVVGVVTGWDIAVRSVAEGSDPYTDRVRDVMTPIVVFCHEDQDVRDAVRLMREKRVRRIVVLDHDDQLAGTLSLDECLFLEVCI